MRKKKGLTKNEYLRLSLGVAILLCFTAMPYLTFNGIVIPGLDIYWDYGKVRTLMFILFPGMALLGVWTTRNKRNTYEDIFFNVASAFNILFIVKVYQYYKTLIWVLFAIGLIYFFHWMWVRIEKIRKKYTFSQGTRKIYYIFRRKTVYYFFLLLSPIVTYFNICESIKDPVILEELPEDVVSKEKITWTPVTEEEWDLLSLDAKFAYVTEFTYFQCDKLGIDAVDVRATKKKDESVLAAYFPLMHDVEINVLYLNEGEMEEVLATICHEAFHAYQNRVMDSLEILDEAGFDYESMEYYAEALAYKKANECYAIDNLNYENYIDNYLEISANEYAKQEIARLKEEGYIKE